MNLLRRIIEKGPRGSWQALQLQASRHYHLWRTRAEPLYVAPNAADLRQFEERASRLGMPCVDLRFDPAAFQAFMRQFAFPAGYHGGEHGGVYLEKLLEHHVAWSMLDLDQQPARWPYVDVAAATSPWVGLLRAQGHEAWGIDLDPAPPSEHAAWYLRGDATASPFETGSIGSASLQCAYEMFEQDADTRLLAELARVLRPGGRAVISPLYTHMRACYYQTPEHYGSPCGDAGAHRTLRRDTWNVRASRKYSPETLHERVWQPALAFGLQPALHALRNADQLGPGLYLHFVLTLDKQTT